MSRKSCRKSCQRSCRKVYDREERSSLLRVVQFCWFEIQMNIIIKFTGVPCTPAPSCYPEVDVLLVSGDVVVGNSNSGGWAKLAATLLVVTVTCHNP